MSETEYLILAIVIIVSLLALFFVGYILNKKTPVPKGCEKIFDEEKCQSCHNTMCEYHQNETKENEETK